MQLSPHRENAIKITLLLVPLVIGLLSYAIQNWNLVFDDAFITYRYAKNLALGHGIVWNINEPPTEGYTNFLLVLLLAPFIKIGIHPLLVTRIFSFCSALAISIMLYWIARKKYNTSVFSSLLVASVILLSSQTRELCLVGLETIIYTLFLFVTFIFGLYFIKTKKVSDSIYFSLMLILTMLLRPEAALIYPVFLLVYFFLSTGNGQHQSMLHQHKSVLIGFLFAVLLGGVYLAWKIYYFNDILPNPFYIKSSNGFGVRKSGLLSVLYFLYSNIEVLLIISWGVYKGIYAEKNEKVVFYFGMGLLGIYALFFSLTDTLMDINGRFMYPMLAIVICVAIPTLDKFIKTFIEVRNYTVRKRFMAVLFFVLVLSPKDILFFYYHVKALKPNEEWKTSNYLMQKEYRIGQSLAGFSEIPKVRIAFGDSGVIPYLTNAIWLDIVGLNDSYIARNRDINNLVDYLFNWQADVIIMPGGKDFLWPTHGHGPLGNMSSWVEDKRWDDYVYVGSCLTDNKSGYDLHFFIRKNSQYLESLGAYITKNVIDGRYEYFPLSIGSKVKSDNTPVNFIQAIDLLSSKPF